MFFDHLNGSDIHSANFYLVTISQDPDVINAPLPIFNRAPSMERDATVMRPVEDENEGCLQVKSSAPSSTNNDPF